MATLRSATAGQSQLSESLKSLLRLQLSNRFETLRNALVQAVGAPLASPFAAQQVVVPSSALRHALTKAIADRHGVCANIAFTFLANWLWQQIARVVTAVETASPFAPNVLTWRLYRLLQESADFRKFPRLAAYLDSPDPQRRLDLAAATADVFDQYITYRSDWIERWSRHESVDPPNAPATWREDQAWQAELWRRLSAQMGANREHPAARFLRQLQDTGAGASHSSVLPAAVHVFCLPTIPPLYMDVLAGLGRWMDVTLYVLNPSPQYWFDIVDSKRLHWLTVHGKAAHRETGNRLLASWGRQTKAQIGLLLEKSGDAPIDDGGYDEGFPQTLLGRVQRAMFDLVELEPASIPFDAADRSIEVHICHSLTRELEVLQDQLLALFSGPSPPALSDVLVVTPDLEAAAPLIEAIFGNAVTDRYLPFAVSGRARSTVNPSARALLTLLTVLASRFPASALLDLLQQPIIGRRFGVGAEELLNIDGWMRTSGIHWGIDADHRREQGLPPEPRFTLEDGLQRLFLGYALPNDSATTLFGRVPAGNVEGSAALDLGRFADFVRRLIVLRAATRAPRPAADWLPALTRLLDEFLLPQGDELEDLVEVREALSELHDDMQRAEFDASIPLQVVQSALQALLDDPARGGVPTGAITFSSLSSLRNLPFNVICLIGLNDGVFPQVPRPREFDLMVPAPRGGDRQRRLDDRNLFLDLLLAARQRFYVSYVGRSIRDNTVMPASVVVSELIETLVPALAATPEDHPRVRAHLLIEHPLQAFSRSYFAADGDPRIRSFNDELCDALQISLTAPIAARSPDAEAAAAALEDESDTAEDASAIPLFFAKALPTAEVALRRVSLDQFVRFFSNPARFLLRNVLELNLEREAREHSDDEPFLAGHHNRQQLAARLLSPALQGIDDAALHALAAAGIEYPMGKLGGVQLADELAHLRRFVARIIAAGAAADAAPHRADLAFDLDGEIWHITNVFTGLRADGWVGYRYDDARAGDYLAAWLTHLVLCASNAPGEHRSRFISRDGDLVLRPYDDAMTQLRTLMSLYRSGLQTPLPFFPKSAWAYFKGGGDVGRARARWRSEYVQSRNECDDPAFALAFRGHPDPIGKAFEECAWAVFGPMAACLDDARIKLKARGFS